MSYKYPCPSLCGQGTLPRKVLRVTATISISSLVFCSTQYNQNLARRCDTLQMYSENGTKQDTSCVGGAREDGPSGSQELHLQSIMS